MNVTILGATGAMGREITSQLIQARALSRREILQLATNPFRRQASRLCADGIRRDLQDAYAEIIPEIQVVEDPEEFIGDVVVIAAGVSIRAGDLAASRRELAGEAAKLCRHYAQPLAELYTRSGLTPIFVIVTNPVEFVVQAFAAALAREVPGGARFVVGMGAHSDSLRFQWEIAHDLGILRDRVSAEVVGEHGPMMIPRWSTVQIRGMPEKEQERCLRRLFEKDRAASGADFDALLEERRQQVMQKLGGGDVFRLIEGFRPDYRVILKPLVIHHTQSKTAHATGVAASRLIHAILRGESLTVSVQRMVRPPGASELIPFGAPADLRELFRFQGARPVEDWNAHERTFAAGSFRAARAVEEERRIAAGLAAMQRQSQEWQSLIAET